MFRPDKFMCSLHGGPLNGFDVMIMQSDEWTQEIIKKFKQRILNGENPNECQDEIFAEVGVDFDKDIVQYDQERIIKEVEEMYRLNELGLLHW